LFFVPNMHCTALVPIMELATKDTKKNIKN